MSSPAETLRGLTQIDTVSPTELSQQLRDAVDGFLTQRRGIVGCALGAAGAMGVITLYQTGLISHLPEPSLSFFDADKVDAAAEAYEWLSAPDAAIGLNSYATTIVLAAMGGKDRAERRPWLPLILALKTGADAVQAAKLTRDQWTKHGAFCFWCLLAAGCSFGAIALAIPEARRALRVLQNA